MWQVGNGLYRLFPPFFPDLIDQQGKYQRRRKPDQQITDAKPQGIKERIPERGIGQKLFEIAQSNPILA